MNELQNKVDLANNEIKKALAYVNERQEIFQYLDIKLHKAISIENELNTVDNFNDFCTVAFEQMLEDLESEHDILFYNHNFALGRTSSFWLHNGDLVPQNFDNSFENTIELVENVAHNYIGLDMYFQNSPYFEIENESEDFFEEDLDIFTEHFYKEVKDNIKDIEIVFNYIDSYKNNQVEYYTEFIENCW